MKKNIFLFLLWIMCSLDARSQNINLSSNTWFSGVAGVSYAIKHNFIEFQGGVDINRTWNRNYFFGPFFSGYRGFTVEYPAGKIYPGIHINIAALLRQEKWAMGITSEFKAVSMPTLFSYQAKDSSGMFYNYSAATKNSFHFLNFTQLVARYYLTKKLYLFSGAGLNFILTRYYRFPGIYYGQVQFAIPARIRPYYSLGIVYSIKENSWK